MIFRLRFRSAANLCPLFASSLRRHVRVSQVRHVSLYQKFIEEVRKGFQKDKNVQESLKELDRRKDELEKSATVQTIKKATDDAKVGSIKIKDKALAGAEYLGKSVANSVLMRGVVAFVKGASRGSAFVGRQVLRIPGMRSLRDAFVQFKKESIDEGSYRYGGVKPKDERIVERESIAKSVQEKIVPVNPEAGASVVQHKDSLWRERWQKMKEANPLIQGLFGLKQSMDQSDNPLANAGRRLSEAMGSLFAESETAQVVKQISLSLPNFTVEQFLREAHTLIIPEVLEAYLKGDLKTLKMWCSEATFNILKEGLEERLRLGVKVEAKILDLRDVDMVLAKMLEDQPVLFVTFHAQELVTARDRFGKLLPEYPENKISRVNYVWAFTRDLENFNPVTHGWKIVDIAIQGIR